MYLVRKPKLLRRTETSRGRKGRSRRRSCQCALHLVCVRWGIYYYYFMRKKRTSEEEEDVALTVGRLRRKGGKVRDICKKKREWRERFQQFDQKDGMAQKKNIAAAALTKPVVRAS